MNRREFLIAGATTAAVSALSRGATPATSKPTTAPIPADVQWHDVREWGIEGRAFTDTEDYFDRLPARAKGAVRPRVWDLSKNSTGMSVRFEADAREVYVRYETTSATLAMEHMPASGVSGVDLYAEKDGAWHWLAVHMPATAQFTGLLMKDIAPGKRRFMLYLPLYNGVKSLAIGVSKSADFSPIAPRKDKPIVFYGTSITQGGCASRPGMAFTNILGRRLNHPMVNLGFSGNGRMEEEVANFIAEIDAGIYVLDCLANMGVVDIVKQTVAVVNLLREKRPTTPILILGEREITSAILVPNLAADHRRITADLKTAYDKLKSAGVKNLHYRAADDVIGVDGEACVDGSHPTDLGMIRYADALEPDLKRILAGA